jgi:hypothetical protein
MKYYICFAIDLFVIKSICSKFVASSENAAFFTPTLKGEKQYSQIYAPSDSL